MTFGSGNNSALLAHDHSAASGGALSVTTTEMSASLLSLWIQASGD